MTDTNLPTGLPEGFTVEMYERHNSLRSSIADESVFFEDALNKIGFGRAQVLVIVAGMVIVTGVFTELFALSLVLPLAKCDLSLTESNIGLLNAAPYLGILVSSHFWGYMVDTEGRRITMLISSLATCISTVISSFMNDFTWLFIFRLISGIFISCNASAIYAYVGEFNSLNNRGTIIQLLGCPIGMAYLVIVCSGIFFNKYPLSFQLTDSIIFGPWRILLIICTLFVFLGALMLLFIPESPKFLLSRNKQMEALKVLQWIYRMNTGRPDSELDVKKLRSELSGNFGINTKSVFGILKMMWRQTYPLFMPPFLTYFTICLFIIFGIMLINPGLGMWYPYIYNSVAKMPEGTSITLCEIFRTENITELTQLRIDHACEATIEAETYYAMLGNCVGFFVVGILSGIVLKFMNARKLLGFTLIILFLSGMGTIFVRNPFWLPVFFTVMLTICSGAINMVVGVVVDLIPTYLRGMATCIMFIAGRIGGVASSIVIGIFLGNSCLLIFTVYLAIILACSVFTMCLPDKVKPDVDD